LDTASAVRKACVASHRARHGDSGVAASCLRRLRRFPL